MSSHGETYATHKPISKLKVHLKVHTTNLFTNFFEVCNQVNNLHL